MGGKSMKLFYLMAIFAVFLASCASTATQTVPAEQTTVIVKDTVFVSKIDTVKIIDSVLIKENLDQMGRRTVMQAKQLHAEGKSAQALAILEGFAVYKPAVNNWIDSANALYYKILEQYKPKEEIDPAKLEVINSLIAQIKNLKNANANSALIGHLADSLRSIAPGDSVMFWIENETVSQTKEIDSFCEEQRKIAANNFASSRKNKSKAPALLADAIEALDKCLLRNPSQSMKEKVLKNKEILLKELN
jgi:hypothetical protein